MNSVSAFIRSVQATNLKLECYPANLLKNQVTAYHYSSINLGLPRQLWAMAIMTNSYRSNAD